ncbi:chaperonin 10-like protein [Pholiota molesta]|nr:chaperonin 10-like protein [Pholiota molesta]
MNIYPFDKYPVVLGHDIAGEVAEIGEGVTDFKVGERVFGQTHIDSIRGSFQQYIISLASTTAKIPSNITYDEAAAIPSVLTAAYVGLHNKNPYGLGIASAVADPDARKNTGTPILVLGGAGSIGQQVIQLARLSGFSPIIATASLKHTERLKSLGATDVLDRNLDTAALSIEIHRLSKNQPLKYIYDSIASAETQRAGFDVLADGGQIAVVLPAQITSTALKTVVQVQGLLRGPANIPLLEPLYHDHLYKFLEEGLIKPNNIEVLPDGLAGIPAGLDRLAAGQVSGLKLVAHPQETA